MIELCLSLIGIYIEYVNLVMSLMVNWGRRELWKLKKMCEFGVFKQLSRWFSWIFLSIAKI